MIKLAVIAPENYLEIFSSLGDIEMCISSVALEQPKYLSYYKQAVQKGRWVIQDNCLAATTKITLANGKKMLLKSIVNNKRKVKVLTLNEKTGKYEAKEVVNWFKRKDKEVEWVQIILEGTKRNGGGVVGVVATKEHKFLVNKQWKQAKDLRVGDKLYTNTPNLTEEQRQLILGSLLGDSTLQKTKTNPYFITSHSDKQLEYLKLKHKLLSPFAHKVGSWPNNLRGFNKRKNAKLCSFITDYMLQLQDIYSLAYVKKKKRITYSWLSKLKAPGLAFWYMDDGQLITSSYSKDQPTWKTGYHALFHLGNISKKEANTVRDYFMHTLKLSCALDLNREKYYVLRLHRESSLKFFTQIFPYVARSMSYKLPVVFKKRAGSGWKNGLEANTPQRRKILHILKGSQISRVSGKYKSYMRYDITVEGNHNFFADGVLVSNSVFELEHALDSSKLLELAREIKPTILVTPEVLHSREETMKLTNAFIKEVRKTDILDHSRLLTVAQGKDPYDFSNCCTEICNHSLINMLGIPFDIEYWDNPGVAWSTNMALNRVKIVNQYLPSLLAKPIHLMGCSDPLELFWQNVFNKDKPLFSLDSSSAITHGANGIKITAKGLPGEKIKTKLDFRGNISSDSFPLIHENINMLKMLARGCIY